MPRNTTGSEKDAVFAGIDFHKKFSVVTLGDSSGKLISQKKLLSDTELVSNYFKTLPKLSCAIENCRGNEWFVDLLRSLDFDVHVANTYAVKLISESRCKTDKIDSKILMELLAKGFLPTIYQPTKEERLLRERLKWRTQLVRSKTQYTNRAHALIDKENRCKLLSSPTRRKQAQEAADPTPERQQLFKTQVEIIEFFDHAVELEDKFVSKLSKAHPQAAILKTIPGIGDLSALLIIAELGDVRRFAKARNVSAYLGLVPKIYSSSDTRRLGSITKQGPKMLRWILVQDAWHAIRASKFLLHRFNNISKRRGKKIAIVATARLLAEVAYRVLRDNTPFDESMLIAQ